MADGAMTQKMSSSAAACPTPPSPAPGPEDAHMWQSHPGKGKHLYRLMGALVFIKVHSLTKRLDIRLEKLPKRKPKMLESNRGGGCRGKNAVTLRLNIYISVQRKDLELHWHQKLSLFPSFISF